MNLKPLAHCTHWRFVGQIQEQITLQRRDVKSSLCLVAADPNRRLLQSPGTSPADTYGTATPTTTTTGSSTVGTGAMGTLGMASTIGTAGSFLSTQGQGTRR
jgi:hypothetical protein